MYSKPGENSLTAFLQEDSELYISSKFSESGFIFAPFVGQEGVIILNSKAQVLQVDFDRANDLSISNVSSDSNADTKFAFEQLVLRGIEAINHGSFEKVVLSRLEKVLRADFDFIAVFQRLLNLYPTAFRYCWFHPRVGFWMGASPEQLLRLTDDRISTMSLAGTQIDTASESVIWKEKELQEQRIVTDFIVDNLAEHSIGMKISLPFTSKAGNLLHIQTDIDATLKEGSDLRDLIQALHPTPAVCGLPREPAREFILNNEGYNREFYTGFLGEINLNNGQSQTTSLFVNLRCLQIRDEATYLYMGCGITKESIAENEYHETVNKSATMKRVLS